MSTTIITDAVFLSSNLELVYIINITNSAYKYRLDQNMITQIQSLGSRIPIQIAFNNGSIVIYSQDSSNPSRGYFTFYAED